MAARRSLVRVSLAALVVAAAAGGLVQAQQSFPLEPVPPPPGVTPAPAPVRPAPPIPALPDPSALPEESEAPVTPAAPPEPEEEEEKAPPPPPPEPLKRTRHNVAILQALDKVTAETMRFEAPVGRSVRYKTLVFTVRACESSAPDEPAPEQTAYVVIDSQPRAAPGRERPPSRQIFRGWMFASSPGLNPVQHPVYDAWLIACKTAPPSPANR